MIIITSIDPDYPHLVRAFTELVRAQAFGDGTLSHRHAVIRDDDIVWYSPEDNDPNQYITVCHDGGGTIQVHLASEDARMILGTIESMFAEGSRNKSRELLDRLRRRYADEAIKAEKDEAASRNTSSGISY